MRVADFNLVELHSSEPSAEDDEDVEELSLLLQAREMRELIQVSQEEGFTAAGLVRYLIRDHLLWMRSDFGRALGHKLRPPVPGEER
jgi:hypothetical protein